MPHELPPRSAGTCATPPPPCACWPQPPPRSASPPSTGWPKLPARPRPTTSSRRLRTGAPQRCRGPCAGSRRSPRHCGQCSPICAPRRRHRPAHLAGPAPRYARRVANPLHLDLGPSREASHGRASAGSAPRGQRRWPHRRRRRGDHLRTIWRNRPGVAARRVRAHHSRPPREPGRRGAGPSRGPGKRRLEAAFPLGDGESLQRLRQRCQDVTARPAGCSALLDSSLPPGRPGSTA